MGRRVTASGPIVDGRAVKQSTRARVAIQNDVAEAVENEIHDLLTASLKNPTGYYESRIVTNRAKTSNQVTDSGVVYGPWLEGTSSRNQTSRFKGYATFRRATQRVEGRAGQIAAITIRPFVQRMNAK